ncbi:MAG: ATP-binding protein [Lentimicrobium sp.]|nr:ATP-binding protein [Lentimicrobium sp.]
MIRDIILTQKRELEQKLLQKYVKRAAPIPDNNTGLIHVIIGPRRAGKSFFGMHQLSKDKDLGFANFDDERLVKVQNFDEILEAILAVYSNPQTLLLDEIQNLPNWEIIANRLQRQGYQLIITGSNSNLLSSELATHLTGRHLPIRIFPFSFSEYVNAIDKEMTQPELKESFNDFLINGGYPEPLINSIDYVQYLQVLFDSTLFKDIVKRYNIRQPGALEDLANYIISNICSEFSLNSLSSHTQISSVHTVKKYLSYLEEAFIFFTLPRFSFKVREQQQSNRKVYCYDNGFHQAKAFNFSNNWGTLLENLIASELIKQSWIKNFKLFYWKSREGEEVDFVIQEGNEITKLIQVCWDLDRAKTREREIRALLKASQLNKNASLLVLTQDEETVEKVSWYGIEGEIRFIPAWKWLLENTF